MSRKFATVSGVSVVLALLITILTGTGIVQAQQAPAQQAPPAQQTPTQPQPETQQPSSQEAAPEEIGPTRKTKVKEYKTWIFNIGGGASLTNGNTKNFVRSGGGIAAAGVAHNYSKYFGLRLDFQFDNLPLRASGLQAAQAPGATSHVYSLALDPIINIPVTKVWGGYIVGGGSFFHRSGKLDSSTAIPGSGCNAFFTWWGNCYNASLPVNRNFLSASQNQWGENFGGGVTRKIRANIELYGEFRYVHGKHNNITTDFRPITVGVRW